MRGTPRYVERPSMSSLATKPRSSWMRRTQGMTSDDSKPGGKRFFHCSNSGMRCFMVTVPARPSEGRWPPRGVCERSEPGGMSSVALAADHVERAEGRHDVGKLVLVQHQVRATEVNEAGRAAMH